MKTINNLKSTVIINYMEKGGVGKTTVGVHTAYELGFYGKTIIVDGAQQGNCLNHLMSYDDFRKHNKSYLKFLINSANEKSLAENIIEARAPKDNFHGLYLLGTDSSNNDLNDFIQDIFPNKPKCFDHLINQAMHLGFRYIVIDPPVSFNLYTKTILSKADHVIFVVEAEPFSIDTFVSFIPVLMQMKKDYNCNFKNHRLIINKFNQKITTHKCYSGYFINDLLFEKYTIHNTSTIPTACKNNKLLQEENENHISVPVFKELALSIVENKEFICQNQ